MEAAVKTYLELQQQLLARAGQEQLQRIARAVLLAGDELTAGLLVRDYSHRMLAAHVPLLQALVGAQVPEIA